METGLRKQHASYHVAYIASIALTALLLLVRLDDASLEDWLFGGLTPAWFSFWYVSIIWASVVSLLWLNRGNLASIKVDKPWVLLLILAGVLLFAVMLGTARVPAGLLVAASTIFAAWAFFTRRLTFAAEIRYSVGTWLLASLSVLPALPMFALAFAYRASDVSLTLQTVVAAMRPEDLSGVMSEELLFRGLLWKYLHDWGLKDNAILPIQALLFWLSHHRYLSSGAWYGFWISLPFAALLFGILAWHSKSLTPSTCSHLLGNFAINVFQNIF